jgi:hypothetical protein
MSLSRSSHSIAAVVLVASIALTAGCSKGNEGAAAPAGAAPVAAAASSPVPSASKLGDLTKFRIIAEEVSATVDKGELAVAKAKIRDLEAAWDGDEAGLKPRAPDDWHVLDKAIDRALASLRASTATQAESQAAMKDLLRTFDSLGTKV